MQRMVKTGEDNTWTHFGLGPWTTFMDWVHGSPVMGPWTLCHGPGPWTLFLK